MQPLWQPCRVWRAVPFLMGRGRLRYRTCPGLCGKKAVERRSKLRYAWLQSFVLSKYTTLACNCWIILCCWDLKDCYKFWLRLGQYPKRFSINSWVHVHAVLAPHLAASFIYLFGCPTNRSVSPYLEIPKASCPDCCILPSLPISLSQKFEASLDPFFSVNLPHSANPQVLPILPPQCLFIFPLHSFYPSLVQANISSLQKYSSIFFTALPASQPLLRLHFSHCRRRDNGKTQTCANLPRLSFPLISSSMSLHNDYL